MGKLSLEGNNFEGKEQRDGASVSAFCQLSYCTSNA